jgi:hypothetical protein
MAKGRRIPSTPRQARFMGAMAGRGAKWARDKLRGRKVGYRGRNVGKR